MQRCAGGLGYLAAWINLLKTAYPRLPRWLSGKESACQCRRPRFDPGRSHMPRSPCATSTEPVLWSREPQLLKLVCLKTVPGNKRSLCNERNEVHERCMKASAMRCMKGPHTTTRSSPCFLNERKAYAAIKIQQSQK